MPCPPPGDLPDTDIEPPSLISLALAGRFFTTSATWEASLDHTKRACMLQKNRHVACMGRQIWVPNCTCISQVPCPDLQSPSFTDHILGTVICSLDNWNTDSSSSPICSLSQGEVVPKEDSWQPEVISLEVLSIRDLTQKTCGVGVEMGTHCDVFNAFMPLFKSVIVVRLYSPRGRS